VQLGDWISLTGVVVTAVGLGLAIHSIYRSNLNSSAASLLAFHEAVRPAWERFLGESEANRKAHHFADLANLLEIACALHVKKVFVGVSREFLTEYLDDVLQLLDESDEAKRMLEPLIHSPTTFKYLRIYLKKSNALHKPAASSTQ